MREIKFRAWDKQKHKWADSIAVYDDGSWSAQFGSVEGFNEEDGVELMQFTGLKDKHGKEIYEGDILSWQRVKRIVIWNNGTFKTSNSKNRLHHANNLYAQKIHKLKIEVIGNIWENPELLK